MRSLTVCSFLMSNSKSTRPGSAAVTRSYEIDIRIVQKYKKLHHCSQLRTMEGDFSHSLRIVWLIKR